MFKSFKVSVPEVSTSLLTLIAGEQDRVRGVLLQCPLTNTGKVYFGSHSQEYAEILNGGAAGLDVSNIRDIYVKGTATDYLIVILY